jgi:hypothetical protein
MIPPLPLLGGCSCGALRYRITATPQLLIACHCTNCQTQSGASFSLPLRVARGSFEMTLGQAKPWHQTTTSGDAWTMWFCGDCGGRIYSERASRLTEVGIRAGTLDDTSWLTPVAHFWTRSAQPWMRFSDDALVYATTPDDFGPVRDAWTKQTGA